MIAYFHGDLKSIKYFSYRKEPLETFQKVTLGHIPNHCLKNTIYLKYTTYTIWQF